MSGYASSPNRATHNVTAETFTKKAVAFINLSDSGEGFVIALQPYPGCSHFKPTPRQWGAWMAYWHKIGVKTKFSEKLGYATTPSEWPHEFDVNATIQGDHAAADAFEAKWRQERESAAFHAGGIAKQASRAVSMWNAIKREQRKPTPESHLHPDVKPSVDLSDFPDANASAAELRAWEAKHKAGEAA